jgi:two-component system response regulator MprA
MEHAVVDAAPSSQTEVPAKDVPRILIVDDDELVRSVLHRAIEDGPLDCQVETAADGVAACIRLPQFRPDLVVLDILMPELSGAEVCWALKTSPRFAATKVLLVTGSPGDPRLRAALAAGADDWMAKPFRMEDFRAKIAELLGLP